MCTFNSHLTHLSSQSFLVLDQFKKTVCILWGYHCSLANFFAKFSLILLPNIFKASIKLHKSRQFRLPLSENSVKVWLAWCSAVALWSFRNGKNILSTRMRHSGWIKELYWVDQGRCLTVPFLNNVVNANSRRFRDTVEWTTSESITLHSFWHNKYLMWNVVEPTGET